MDIPPEVVEVVDDVTFRALFEMVEYGFTNIFWSALIIWFLFWVFGELMEVLTEVSK